MPYTYTELDLGVLQVCRKCVTRHVASVSQACETPFIPHVSPNSVHKLERGHFKLSNDTMFVKIG